MFAISGALVASRKRLDPVGFALIATVTGIGGGTVRDLLLGQPVYWVNQPSYVVLCVLVALAVYVIAPHIEYRFRILMWADAFGLSLFCVLGASVALNAGFNGITAVLMGVLSSTFGGLIRDVFCGEIPLILRKEIYATAAFLGALVFTALNQLTLPYPVAELAGVMSCFIVRALGITSGLSLPNYRPREGRNYPKE